MAYFVRIGVVRHNKSGVGARGFHLFRRGSVVITRWGGIIVMANRSFHWATCQEKTYRCASPESAKRRYRELFHHRTNVEKYEHLPRGIRIGRLAGAAKRVVARGTRR